MADIKILDLTEATEITETTDYIPVVDTSDTTQDSTGTTKKATVRKLLGDRVLPDTIVGTTETQTLSNKTLTSPVINTPTGDVVTPTGTQTLTNKTLTSPKINEDVVLTATSTELNKITGMLDWFYPVGTIYETTSTDLDTTTKMGNHFGGTWEVYGAGRVLVAKSDDTEFDTIGKTGGSKTHTLTAAEIPKIDVYGAKSGTGGTTVYRSYTSGGISDTFSGVIGQVQGGEQPHNNLQPYIVVYRYRRIS